MFCQLIITTDQDFHTCVKETDKNQDVSVVMVCLKVHQCALGCLKVCQCVLGCLKVSWCVLGCLKVSRCVLGCHKVL